MEFMSVISMEYALIQGWFNSHLVCILLIFIVKCVNLSKLYLAHQTIVFILDVQKANILSKVEKDHPAPTPQHLLCLKLQPVPLACLNHL